MTNIYNFLIKIFQTFLTLIKIIILSKPLPNNSKKVGNENCLILGNGPSLNDSLNDSALFENKYIFCVNYFPTSPLFEKLKPNFLILQAPEFWLDNVNESYIIGRKYLFKSIIEKTNWPLTIFIPIKIKNNKKFNQLISINPQIKICYFNDTPIEGFTLFKHYCFEKNLGFPRPHNVIIPSLMIAINHGFKNIYLTGVDHSWLKEISVNNKNEALVGQQHFYESTKVNQEVMYKLGVRPRKLHEILEKFMITFKSYFEIKEYADSKNIVIYNTTKDSFIDAFERL